MRRFILLLKKVYPLFSWLAFLGYLGVIFYLSSLSSVPVPELFPQIDKVIHLTAYLILGFLSRNAFDSIGIKLGTWPFLVAALYGVSDEYHQSFVPGRDCSLYDWIADCAGCVLGVYFVFPVIRRFLAKKVLLVFLRTADL